MMNPDMLQADRFGPDSPDIKTDETVHDLKNLLVGMRFLVELALEELPSESPLRHIIEQTPAACQESQELVETLGLVGRRAVAPSRHGCFDMSALVESESFLLAASVPRGVKLEFELSAHQGMIRVNPIQFRQVLMNLVVNALQALDGRQGTVVVRTGSTNLGQYRCECSHADDVMPGFNHTQEVSDTGCGMDEATQARVLEPLFTTKLNGQGLGLASVRRIVTEHRGAIQLRSSPGVGTSVRVLFPPSGKGAEELGKDFAPPQTHQFPKPDPKVVPKPRPDRGRPPARGKPNVTQPQEKPQSRQPPGKPGGKPQRASDNKPQGKPKK